jgi:protein-S-isoprenylcysteine O-methyltransferase Ste14
MPLTGTKGARRGLRQIELDILGPRSHLDLHRFRRLRMALERIKSPWDAALVTGVAGGLWAVALFGAMVIIWSGGTVLIGAIGVLLIILAVALAAHLVAEPSARSIHDS